MDAVRRRRIRTWIVVALLLLVLGLDLARAPRDQLTARFLVGSIHLYQAVLSPRLGALGVRCRFKPSCSHYAEGAIREYGAWTGSWKAAWRVLRCGPWTPVGTVDYP